MIERAFDSLGRAVLNLKYEYVRARIRSRLKQSQAAAGGQHQALDVYSDPTFVETVDAWGEGTAWVEIQHLLAAAEGPVLDIACGTGTVLKRLESFRRCQVHGCDISPFLVSYAAKQPAARGKLVVCDATRLPYRDDVFAYSYSIGSLEHFSETGIDQMLAESRRVTRTASFHQIPTSRSGRNEGWITVGQSYFNNSTDWWLTRFSRAYPTVMVLDSRWEDAISLGRWFVCSK
jgi:SAM-dependent methyltransferase